MGLRGGSALRFAFPQWRAYSSISRGRPPTPPPPPRPASSPFAILLEAGANAGSNQTSPKRSNAKVKSVALENSGKPWLFDDDVEMARPSPPRLPPTDRLRGLSTKTAAATAAAAAGDEPVVGVTARRVPALGVPPWSPSKDPPHSFSTKTARNEAVTASASAGVPPPGPTLDSPPSPWTALRLVGASPSLLPSDFYRLAPQAAEVPGWTTKQGLCAVLQDRHPITYEALGQYTLLFDSRAAAVAYLDTAERVHTMARDAANALSSPVTPFASGRHPRTPLPGTPEHRAEERYNHRYGSTRKMWRRGPMGAPLPPSSPFQPPPAAAGGGKAPIAPALTAEDQALMRAFTLVPPSASLNLFIQPETSSEEEDATRRANNELTRAVAARDAAPVHVLMSLTGRKKGATVSTIQSLIDKDSRRRALPWRLRAREPIVPVRALVQDRLAEEWLRLRREPDAAPAPGAGGPDVTGQLLRRSMSMSVANSGGSGGGSGTLGRRSLSSSSSSSDGDALGDDDDDVMGHYQLFVVSFADAVEAKRFVRMWQRKRIIFPREKVWTCEMDLAVLWY